MLRLALPLLVALMLAGSAQARSQPRPDPQALYYSSYGNPRPLVPPQASAATTSSDGPSWTLAVLAGVAVILAFGTAGVFAGRASVRPQTR